MWREALGGLAARIDDELKHSGWEKPGDAAAALRERYDRSWATLISRCSSGRRIRRRDWRYVRSFFWCLRSSRSGSVLRPSLHGDQTWLAFADRSSVRAAASQIRRF